MLKFLRSQRDTLQQERDGFQADLDGIVEQAETEKRTALNDEELAKFDELRVGITSKDEEIRKMDERIKAAEDDEARAEKVAEVRKTAPEGEKRTSDTKVTDPATYRNDPNPKANSFVRDLAIVGLNQPGARDAHERLERNNREVKEARALTTTDGAGGDFVPPLYVVQQYVELARTARPTADRVQNQTLPSGTDSITVPRIATGTAVAEQATQNTTVQNTDATTAGVTANVATIAGGQTVSMQLIEQSPINLDTILLQDLALDYAAKVDLFVLNNNAAGKLGLLQQSGFGNVAYTDASPTVGEFWLKLADAVQRVTTSRFLPPDTIVMHPRRWAWLLGAVDSTGRPVITVTPGQNAQNSLGTATGVASANGVVGNLQGLDVILDPQIPTNLGAGTNEDTVIVFRAQDSILWEGAPNAEAFRETNAATLSVYLRFYRYAAFTTARYTGARSIIGGTGLIAPTF